MRPASGGSIASSEDVRVTSFFARFEGPLAAYVGAALLLVGAVSTYWDIATHIDIGRERFLTPPHIGIYLAVLLSAVAIAFSGLADHMRAGDSFVTAVRHPFRNLRPGIGIAGAGMLTTLFAAPFDNAWHEIYGLDVTIWSPPHLLAIFGIAAATLGLAALVAPAVSTKHTVVYPMLLSAFLTALLVTTGEFEFNAPQYRIAYHPVILAAAASLVFTAAAGHKWRASVVALWFELVRLASVAFLFGMGRSLTFVPLVLPAALVADALAGKAWRRPALGLPIAAVTVGTNWILLELLPGLQWPADDLLLGAPMALVAGILGGWLGAGMGNRLDGHESSGTQRRARRVAAAAVLFSLLLVQAPSALAHEVGGRRGAGTVSWQPVVPEAGQPIDLRIEDLSLESGARPKALRVEAWRAEHRIAVPVGANRSARIILPEQGLWFLFVRAEVGGENLLWGDHFTVAEEGEGEAGIHRQRFSLGVDTLARAEPPAWVDALAYGVAIAVLLLLIQGVMRALRRLPAFGPQGEVAS